MAKQRDMNIFTPMQRNEDLSLQIYAVVARIPFGRVTTYGHIAQALGLKSARIVGWALRNVPDPDIPCHRVVNRSGELTGSVYFGTPTLMRELLEAEGVEFVGEKVNMKKFLWVPADEE